MEKLTYGALVTPTPADIELTRDTPNLTLTSEQKGSFLDALWSKLSNIGFIIMYEWKLKWLSYWKCSIFTISLSLPDNQQA